MLLLAREGGRLLALTVTVVSGWFAYTVKIRGSFPFASLRVRMTAKNKQQQRQGQRQKQNTGVSPLRIAKARCSGRDDTVEVGCAGV